jgi:ribose 5-phosphate isomerase A
MIVDLTKSELGKKVAAAKALEFVKSGMVIGLGTGSTAAWFLKLLAERIITEGLIISCVPTSDVTKEFADKLFIPLTTIEEVSVIDLVVDGADEFDPMLNLIKGGGGALLQEKIVAAAANHMIVIADYTKEVCSLGAFDLPVEVVKFGARSTKTAIEEILKKLNYTKYEVLFRAQNSQKFVTDEKHFIIDLKLNKIEEPQILHNHLIACPGVVETGLFLNLANTIVVGKSDGTCKVIGKERPS